MKVRFFSKHENSFTSYSEDKLSLLIDRTCMNYYVSAARLLGSVLDFEISSEDWDNFSYIYKNKFNGLLSHVVMTSFTHEDTIFVPVPNLNFSYPLIVPGELLPTLEESILNSPAVVLDSEPRFTSFTVHSDPDYISIFLQDYTPFSGINELLYCGHFKQGQEKWNTYYLPLGDFPDIEAMPNLKGLVISGSKYNMTDIHLPFIAGLKELIRKAYARNVKILGFCLGHQAVAAALEGEVGPNPSRKFIYRLEECISKEENFIGNYKIAEIHGQCVLKVPECLEVLHSSESCEVESMYKKGSVFTSQGHPEVNSHLMINLFSKRLLSIGTIDRRTCENANAQFEDEEPDTKVLLKKLNSFLRDNNL